MEASDTSEPKGGWRANWATEGIILGAVSVIAYFLALSYETGRCEAFDIPHELIAIGPLQLFRGALFYIVVLFATMTFFSRDLLELFFRIPEGALPEKKDSPGERGPLKRKRAGFNLRAVAKRSVTWVSVLTKGLFSWFFGPSRGATVLQAMLFATAVWIGTPGMGRWPRIFLALLAFAPPLVIYRMLKQLESYSLARSSTLPFRLALLMLTLGAWLHVYHFWWGYDTARREDHFHIMPGKPERVVLAIYGSHLITAPLDRGAKHWRSPLTIQSLGDSGAIQLQREQVGPLSKGRGSEPSKPVLSTPGKAP